MRTDRRPNELFATHVCGLASCQRGHSSGLFFKKKTLNMKRNTNANDVFPVEHPIYTVQ